MFTAADAASYALRHSPPYCPALYSPVCAEVGDLPPYQCSRKVYPTFFTKVGTAYANTSFFLSMVLFVFAYVLTRLSKRYPPVGTNVHGTLDGSSSASKEHDEKEVEKDVEMSTIVDTENPLAQAAEQ